MRKVDCRASREPFQAGVKAFGGTPGPVSGTRSWEIAEGKFPGNKKNLCMPTS